MHKKNVIVRLVLLAFILHTYNSLISVPTLQTLCLSYLLHSRDALVSLNKVVLFSLLYDPSNTTESNVIDILQLTDRLELKKPIEHIATQLAQVLKDPYHTKTKIQFYNTIASLSSYTQSIIQQAQTKL